jgi:hypothetical protein
LKRLLKKQQQKYFWKKRTNNSRGEQFTMIGDVGAESAWGT